MNSGNFVAYYRVSTEHQSEMHSLKGQEAAVLNYLNGGPWKLVGSFTEIESGKSVNRPELEKALKLARLTKGTLLIARLDRLTRNLHFLTGLQNAGVKFQCCDMPNVNELTINLVAAVAQEEARLISMRTKEGLAAAKSRGVKLGKDNLTDAARIVGREKSIEARSNQADQYALDLEGIISEIQKQGITTLTGISKKLNQMEIKTIRGKEYFPATVKKLLSRIEKLEKQAP